MTELFEAKKTPIWLSRCIGTVMLTGWMLADAYWARHSGCKCNGWHCRLRWIKRPRGVRIAHRDDRGVVQVRRHLVYDRFPLGTWLYLCFLRLIGRLRLKPKSTAKECL